MSSDSYSNINNSSSDRIYITTESQKIQSLDQCTSEVAVWRALTANLGIAGIKLICWVFSHSSAMLSEAIHSGVDSFNSLCLLVGLRRGSKPADKFHPFGYGLEANIWALFACVLMLIGTAVSIYSGIHRLLYNHNEVFELLQHYHLIALTLIGSIAFEAWAVSSASAAVLHEAEVPLKSSFENIARSFKYIKKIKSPTTKFVWYEDTAALSGVIIAFIALTISKYFVSVNYAYLPDAIASILIGFILLSLAIYLLKHNINSLTGAAAGPQTEKMIKEIATKVHGVSQLHDLKTMDMGSSGLIVNMKIEVDPETQVKDADDIAEKVEQKIREKIKNIAHITIEMQADDAEDNWSEKFDKLIEEGKQIGLLKPFEASMLSKFFDFTDTVVYEIMVPRTEVTFVDADSSIDELVDLIIESGHTRIPVYRESIDNIIGVINAKDVLKAYRERSDKLVSIEELAREVPIVPENKSISDMLSVFNSTKNQLAAVIDEHGGVAGIVTVEDVIEEIVGEIYDEFDVVQTAEIERIDENTLSVAAKVDIEDFNNRFNMDLSTEDFQTVGGYLFGLLGRVPEVGDEITDGEITFRVESVEGHKITRLTMYKPDGFVDQESIDQESPEIEQEE